MLLAEQAPLHLLCQRRHPLEHAFYREGPPVTRFRFLLGGTLFLAGAAGPAEQLAGALAPDGLRLDGLDRAVAGQPLPPGWDVRAVRGFDAPTSRVVEDPNLGPVIRFEATGQAAFFWRELDSRLDPSGGRLRWRWRVDRPVTGADLRVRARDDAPARLFVVFGTRGIFSRPRIIVYSWGNRETQGGHWSSPADARMHIVVVRNHADPIGTWIDEDRDLNADYRAAFDRDPEPVSAIGFMIDTDNTGQTAVGLLGPVRWAPAAAQIPSPHGRHAARSNPDGPRALAAVAAATAARAFVSSGHP